MRRLLAAVLVAATALTGCASDPAPTPAPEPEHDVGVQLFQWSWEAIGAECAALGEQGIGWVLTSPPQEHLEGDQWWTSYQPVSYAVESRLGSREDFAAMAESCDAAGVDVIADAVINHMAGVDSGVGTAGTAFTHYDYPGLYEEGDFHHCGLTPDDDIADYGDRAQVQTCELVNLADLDTGSEHVRATIVAYLSDLLSLGVDGFRFDAAKHVDAADLEAIASALPGDPTIIAEVIRGPGEPIVPDEYVGLGPLWEFGWAESVGDLTDSGLADALADLSPGPYGWVESDDAVTFVANHDTERNGSTLSYRDPAWDAAVAYMLATDYGSPMLYSGYAFDLADTDAGPTQPAACDHDDAPDAIGGLEAEPGTWTCAHATTSVSALVEWRATAISEPISAASAVDDVVVLERASSLAAINVSNAELTVDIETALPAGDYVDAVSGDTVTVADGVLSVTLAPFGAAAFDVWDES